MSIASILADVDHLIPEAFAPVDINITGSYSSNARDSSEVISPINTEKNFILPHR